MAQTDILTDKQTDGHGDSMTDPAQRAESVKRYSMATVLVITIVQRIYFNLPRLGNDLGNIIYISTIVSPLTFTKKNTLGNICVPDSDKSIKIFIILVKLFKF